MLYFVSTELKGGYPVPAEEWLQIVVKGMDAVMDYKKQGKIVMHAGVVGRHAGIMVWDVDSNEELQRLLTGLSFWPFMEWEIVPLISTEQTIESIKQSLAAVHKSKR